jgi:hypothetical protein
MTSSSRKMRVILTHVTDVPTLLRVIESLHTLGHDVRDVHFDLDDAGHGTALLRTALDDKALDQALHKAHPDVYVGLEELDKENGHDQPEMA